MNQQTIKYAEKARILADIVANFKKEKQAVNKKNFALFTSILKERELLLESLGKIDLHPPENLVQNLQYQHLLQLISELRAIS